MARIKWIKLATDVFENQKIRQIETLPQGDSLIVIWFKLLCLAGSVNDRGAIYLTKEIPYTEQMLSAYFHRPLTVIQMALNLFQKFGMIDVVDDIMHVSSWEKYQNVDGMEKIREQTKKRVAAHRKNQKLLAEKETVKPCNVTCNVTVTQSNATDKDIDIEEDIYSNKEIDNTTVEFCENSTCGAEEKDGNELSVEHVLAVICKEYRSKRNNKTESRKPLTALLHGTKKYPGLGKPTKLNHIQIHYAVLQYMLDCERKELEPDKILLLSTFLNGRILDYVEQTAPTYETYMQNKYGADWPTVRFTYR